MTKKEKLLLFVSTLLCLWNMVYVPLDVLNGEYSRASSHILGVLVLMLLWGIHFKIFED